VSLGEYESEATGVSGRTDNRLTDGSCPNSSTSRGLEFPGVKLWFAFDPEAWLGKRFNLLPDVGGRGPAEVTNFVGRWGMCPGKAPGTGLDDD